MTQPRILIVEDEFVVAKELQMILTMSGYSADTAASGEKAIQAIGRNRPDLVLMDIMIQGELDGIDLAHYLNTHYQIPVIYLTAYTDKKTLERAKLTEPYGYLVKPFKEKDVYTMIEISLFKAQKLDPLPSTIETPEIVEDVMAQVSQKIELFGAGALKQQLEQTAELIASDLERLLYVKAKGPHIEIHWDRSQNPMVEQTVSFQWIKQLYVPQVLLQIHRSYVIHPGRGLYIKKKNIRDSELWLREHTDPPQILPVGRNFLADLREKYPHWFAPV
ncbi:MAG: response regulator [SAR324 cluster bacterium]|nr:response regulator [SAR324 cluster bacterium]